MLSDKRRCVDLEVFECNTWEGTPSFLTCVKAYFVVEFFDIPGLKMLMLSRIEHHSKLGASSINGDNRRPLWQVGDCIEKTHIRPFIRAVEVFETQFQWRPNLQKALYDAGERMTTCLMEVGEFYNFKGTEIGKKFARAIGI